MWHENGEIRENLTAEHIESWKITKNDINKNIDSVNFYSVVTQPRYYTGPNLPTESKYKYLQINPPLIVKSMTAAQQRRERAEPSTYSVCDYSNARKSHTRNFYKMMTSMFSRKRVVINFAEQFSIKFSEKS